MYFLTRICVHMFERYLIYNKRGEINFIYYSKFSELIKFNDIFYDIVDIFEDHIILI